MGAPYEKIAITAGTTQVVVPGVQGKRVRLLGFWLTSDVDATFRWQSWDGSTGTDLSGPSPIGSNGGVSAWNCSPSADGPWGIAESLQDQGLRLLMSTNATVGGSIVYIMR